MRDASGISQGRSHDGGEAGLTTFSTENDGRVGTIKKASGGGGHRRRPITPFNPPLRSIRDQNSIKGLCLPLKEEGIVETRIESGLLKGLVCFRTLSVKDTRLSGG